MGKVARLTLSTSKLRFGGGRYGRIARQAVREHVDTRTTNRVILEALHRAGLDEVPDEREAFLVFFRGALSPVLRGVVPRDAHRAIVAHIEESLRKVGAADSGVKARERGGPVRLLLVGASAEVADAVAAECGDHPLVRARDLLDAMGGVTDAGPMAVILDATVQLLPAVLRTLAKLLPAGTRVIQWGGPAALARPDGVRWERLDPSASPAEVVARCLRESVVPDAVPRVLVVDDDDAWRQALTRRLTAEGYDVIGVADATAALEACVSHEPSLVLSDYDMPDVDGGQLGALIAQRLGAQAPPFLLVTSSQVEARDLPGVLAAYPKAADLDPLLRRAARILERTRKTSER